MNLLFHCLGLDRNLGPPDSEKFVDRYQSVGMVDEIRKNGKALR